MWLRRAAMILSVTAAAALTLIPVTPVSTTAGFLLLAYVPGRLLLRSLGIEHHWSASGRTLLAVAVSLVVVPVFLNGIWHVTHDPVVMLVAVWCASLLLILLQRAPSAGTGGSTQTRRPFIEHRPTRIAMAMIAAVIVPAVVLPYWPTELLGYPVPSDIHDFIKHHAVMAWLERGPLPLGNVFYAEGAGEPVYYYHFFYLIPATVRIWTGYGLSLELAFGLAGALVALATTGFVYAITKRLAGGEGPASLAAAMVTVIGALDIIPLTGHMIHLGRPVVVQDAWAMHAYRIHNFLNQMIWCPQNVNAILGVLVGVYVLSTRRAWRGWFLLGPVLGASIVGSSIWVAIGALPALAIWAMTRRRHLPAAVMVGALMLALSGPTLRGYADTNARQGGSLTLAWPANKHALLGRLVAPGIVANFLDLPFRLAIEFGARILFLPLVSVGHWRRAWRDDGLRWLCIASIVSLLAATTVHSRLAHNAFGQRIILIPMVLTSIMAGCAFARTPGRSRWWNPAGWTLPENHRHRGAEGDAGNAPSRGSDEATAGQRRRLKAWFVGLVLAAGLPVGLYEAPLTAVRRYVNEIWAIDPGWDPAAAARVREQRQAEHAACRFMRHELPADAVVQCDPSGKRAPLAQIILSDRKPTRRLMGVIGPQADVLVFDPPDRDRYLRCYHQVLDVLRHGVSAARTRDVLRRHGITHVYIGAYEAGLWSHLERFDNREYFTDVFRRGSIRVIALVPTRDARTPLPLNQTQRS